MKCGEKWERNHKCPQQVPLHVLEELWDVVHQEASSEEDMHSNSSDEELLTLSLAALEGLQGRKTIRLQGDNSEPGNSHTGRFW